MAVSIMEPGPVNLECVPTVRASLAGRAGLESEPYRPLLAAYLAGTQEAFATLGQTGDDVAAVIVKAATADSPHFRYVTSEVVRGLVAHKYGDAPGATVVALSGARLSCSSTSTRQP